MTIPPELREFAQSPDRYTWLSDDVERYVDEHVCVIQGSVWAGVSAVRADAGDLDDLIASVHARVPHEKKLVWWLDPDVQPPDLEARLLARGLREPEDGAGTLHALACVEEPAAGPPDVVVSRVETFDEHCAAYDVMWDAFGISEERREEQRPHLRREFDAAQRATVPVTFLAYADGRPAGVGRSIYSDRGVFLIAGSVVPWARGRGIYRALVRARWDDAVQRGTPGLVTEAMPDTSYPILKRLGFEEVCTVRRLEDPR